MNDEFNWKLWIVKWRGNVWSLIRSADADKLTIFRIGTGEQVKFDIVIRALSIYNPSARSNVKCVAIGFRRWHILATDSEIEYRWLWAEMKREIFKNFFTLMSWWRCNVAHNSNKFISLAIYLFFTYEENYFSHYLIKKLKIGTIKKQLKLEE
jgi:hypothetical protein